MKKFLTISLALTLICAFSACSDGQESSIQDSSVSTASTAQVTETVQTTADSELQATTAITTEQPVSEESSLQTTADITTITTKNALTTTVTATEENSPQEVDVSEGIVFDTPVEEKSDEEIISAGFALFRTACETEWNFTVGSPYELDTSQTAQNQFGWDCYLVTTEGINSLADVRADFHKIFSEKYEDTLDEVFTESNGHVYCLNGARGSDIFYEKSEITAINSRSENEISFTVDNFYSDNDFNEGAYVQSDEFVITVDSDGAWRVSKFRMPY